MTLTLFDYRDYRNLRRRTNDALNCPVNVLTLRRSPVGDEFRDLDWMTERMDLSEFDLDSLIGSCSADDDVPSSPESLLASLDSPTVLDALPQPPPQPAPLSPPSPAVIAVSTPTDFVLSPSSEPGLEVDLWEAASPLPCVPEPQEELEIKSEPDSPAPSPAYTLDLGSEVDVVDCEAKPALVAVPTAVVPPVPRIILSLSPTRIVVLLTPKDQVTTTVTNMPAVDQSSPRASPTSSRPSRSRPYPDPSLQSPSTSGAGKVRSTRGSTGEAGCGGGGSSSSSSSSYSGGSNGGGGVGVFLRRMDGGWGDGGVEAASPSVWESLALGRVPTTGPWGLKPGERWGPRLWVPRGPWGPRGPEPAELPELPGRFCWE